MMINMKFIGLCTLMLLASCDTIQASECFASSNSYWIGFRDYWLSAFRRQNTMVLAVVGLGALGIFIITRGKWRK